MSWDLVGHEWAAGLLAEHVAGGRIRHAYLFTGPPGLGRRTLALRLAQALNCQAPSAPGQPCRSCRACTLIERMQHPDLAVIQAETRGGVLKVDQVRELQRSLSLAPYEARYRVALLLRFEEANPNAANALLKTLEEPSPQVILALTAENAETLLPTIVSRCEVVRLRPLPPAQVSEGLQARWGAPPEQANLLAHISGGRPGYAVQLLQQPERMQQRQAALDDGARLLRSDRVQRFAYVDPLYKDKDAARETLRIWLSYWRDVLLQAAGAALPVANLDREAEIQSLAERLGLAPARSFLAALERTMDLLGKNVNTRLALEALMLAMPRV